MAASLAGPAARLNVRIAIDASRTTVERVTGTEHYATQLIRALITHNTQHSITLYFRAAPPAGLFRESERVTQRVIPLSRLWTHVRLAGALWQERPDVTFVPAHTLPLLFPGRAVVTVHDLGYQHFPGAHSATARRYLDWTTRHSARRAAHILADSRATAADLTHFYGTQPAKIHVIYPGVEPPLIGDSAAIRAKYDLPERYFLFMGTLQPRKNIARIVQAYTRWKSANPNAAAALVLAGGKGWLYDDGWTAGVDGVHLPGYIDEADKGALLAGALALVFPTLYEGFGFPVVEALHCGTAVIASETSSLPEVVGEAGLLVNPLDTEAIAAAMTRLSRDDTLRQALRAKGREQAMKFTWDRAAAQTLDVLEMAAR